MVNTVMKLDTFACVKKLETVGVPATQAETHVMRARLKSLVDERLPDVFVRIHKSTIVNLTYIESLQPLSNSEYTAILANGKSLKVSRTYARALRQRLLG